MFDQYQRWKPRPYAFDQPVRIVLIDEESLKRLGQWPWPRERLAALVEALKGAGAAAIAFDFLFAEKDRADANAATGQTPDDVFARAIDGAPVVLGSFVSEAPSGPGGSVKAGFVTAGDDATKFLTPSPGALAPLSQLAQHAAGVGFLNWRPDSDRVVRRVPLILNVDGALHPSLAMEALRVAQGASTYIVKSSNASGETAFGEVYGVLAIRNGDLTIDTDPAGDIRVYFARPDPRRSIPAWKVLEPGADLSGLRGAIVFVGASAAPLSDIVATPLTPVMPGVEAHAQIVEQLLSGQTLTKARLGAEFGVDGDGAHLRGAGGDDLDARALSRGARLRRRGRRDRCGQLVRVFPSRRADRADLSGVFRRRGLFHRRLDALCGQAPSGARDPFRLWPIRLARGGRPARGNAGRARARRLAARADAAVLRHPVVHDHLGGVQRLGAHPLPQRISDPDDRRHPRPRGHDRQIYGRRHHGVLERPARRSRACGACGRIRRSRCARRWSR